MEMLVAALWITSIILVALLVTPLRFILLKRDVESFFSLHIEIKAQRQAASTAHMRDYIKNSLVFLGDSITEEFPLSEYFWTSPVVNRGISGDTARGVLQRVQETVCDLKPAVVFLLIGTNDIAQGRKDKEILRDIQTIIETLVRDVAGVKIHLVSILPINKTEFTEVYSRVTTFGRTNARIVKLNKDLLAMSVLLDLNYIDVYSVMADSQGELRKDYSIEGLHLTGKAYRRLAEVYRLQEPKLV